MRFAVMDIGYNAIRAAVYENNTLGALEIFNDKFRNDILLLLSQESFEVKRQTYLSIQHLMHIFEHLNVSHIKCVATAVLRNHPKAESFVEYIKQKYNFSIQVISGEEEARLTAQGLISSIDDVSGIIVDLGGGSLELAEVCSNEIKTLNSLPLGTKMISSKSIKSNEEIARLIIDAFPQRQYDNLYLIGGAFRFIARIYIEYYQYPIKSLHNLEITAQDFANFIQTVRTSPSQIYKNTNSKRRMSMPAILATEALIKVFGTKTLVISSYGLKEGVRLELLSKEERAKDLVEEQVANIMNYDRRVTNFDSYIALLGTIFPDICQYKRILKIAIMLLPLRHHFDKTLPPKAISEYILSSAIPFGHKMRIMLALILSYTQNYNPNYDVLRIAKKVITRQEGAVCQILAHFMQLAEEIDGPLFTSPSFKIRSVNGYYLEIEWKEILPHLSFERIRARLKNIAYAKKLYSTEELK